MCKIAFLGGGSMTEAIISGINAKGEIKPSQMSVMNKQNQERLIFLNQKYGVTTAFNYENLLKDASVVVVAVKPKDVFDALTSIKPFITKNILLISVVAGISIVNMEKILSENIAIVRCMPNTSATVGKSATAMSTNQHVTKEQLELTTTLLEAIGIVKLVKEAQLDAVTGLSGSGPAYIYYLVEAMQDSAEQIGLEKEAAKSLILQTIIGAAEMLLHSPKTPQTLRQEVTSPGGTTEAGLKVLQSKEVKSAFIDCIIEATEQSKRMGKKLTEEINTKSLTI